MHPGTKNMAYKNLLTLNEGKTQVILFGPSLTLVVIITPCAKKNFFDLAWPKV